MPKTIFHYEGRDAYGNSVIGDIEANNAEEIVSNLKQQNIIPINIEAIKQKNFQTSSSFFSQHKIFNKVEPYHLMNFFSQLAVLHDAGLSVIKAISKLSESASSRPLGIILSQVAKDIASGFTLADSLKKYPHVFTPIMINVIDIGENTGHLSETLKHLGTYLEKSIANRRRLLSSIRYPIFVMVTIVAAVLVLNYMVIPKFSAMFARTGLELPFATRLIMSSSNFMVNNVKTLLAAVIIFFFGINRLLKIPTIRYVWDKYKLHLPVFGSLQKRIITSQFTWTFSLILRAGVPIIKGMTLASTTTENTYFSSRLLKMSTAIEHGENLSRAVIASKLFTPITIQMIEVGEESERIDEALAEVAKYYDAEIDFDLKRLGELIEPFLLMLIGGIVEILAVGIYFPLWDLIKVANV